MSAAPGERAEAAGVFALALGLHAAIAFAVARAVGVPLASLAAFFDGSIYLEIARSFPLPYAPAAPHYASHAPGYPALIYLLRQALPLERVHWGWLALGASWVPAALAVAVFHGLCRDLGLRPRLPTLAFACLHPRWLGVAASAHAESLAMLLVLLAARADRRNDLRACALWLAAAGLTRYPALLVGAAVAWGALVDRRERRPGRLALLALPPLGFGLFQLYLQARLPGFGGLSEAYRTFWDTHLTWPFASLAGNLLAALRGEPVPGAALAYGAAALYLVSLAVAWRSPRPELRWLGVWVAAVALFHASLAGEWGGFDYARLTLLAWPAALLVLWCRFAGGLGPRLAPALLAGAGALSLSLAVGTLADGARWQGANYPWPGVAMRGFYREEPRWVDHSRWLPPSEASPGEAGGAEP